MVEIPNELIGCILETLDFDSDKTTLLSCALVGRAWVCSAQRGIFRSIVLICPELFVLDIEDCDPQDVEEYVIECMEYIESITRLAELFDKVPRLASYVRCLKLEGFQEILALCEDCCDTLYTTTARVLYQLSNIEDLRFWRVDWNVSASLRTGLMSTISAPSVTRVSISESYVGEVPQFLSLLDHMSQKKSLEFDDSLFRDWNTPKKYRVRPRTVQLDHLRSDTYLFILLKDFSALQLQSLRSLVLDNIDSRTYEMVASVLQHTGHSLETLKLVYDFGLSSPTEQYPNSFHLGYTPNLTKLELSGIPQSNLHSPIPILFFLGTLMLDFNKKTHPLKCLVLSLAPSHWGNLWKTALWEKWAALDALLARPEFASLEMVTLRIGIFILHINDWEGPEELKELVFENLPLLKESGKLKVIIGI